LFDLVINSDLSIVRPIRLRIPLPLQQNLSGNNLCCVRCVNRVSLKKVSRNRAKNTETRHPDSSGGKARNVSRGISGRPEKDTVDGCSVPKTVDKTNRDGTLLGWGGDDVGCPHEDKRGDAIDASEGEDSEDVSDHIVRADGDDDEEDRSNTGE